MVLVTSTHQYLISPVNASGLPGGVVGRGGRASEVDWWLTGSWFRACVGETVGESHTPIVAGGVDGGVLGRRSFVEGVDVAAPTCLFLAVLQGKP
jgi:hypothetical protein